MPHKLHPTLPPVSQSSLSLVIVSLLSVSHLHISPALPDPSLSRQPPPHPRASLPPPPPHPSLPLPPHRSSLLPLSHLPFPPPLPPTLSPTWILVRPLTRVFPVCLPQFPQACAARHTGETWLQTLLSSALSWKTGTQACFPQVHHGLISGPGHHLLSAVKPFSSLFLQWCSHQ
jgi:hypothetical protein